MPHIALDFFREVSSSPTGCGTPPPSSSQALLLALLFVAVWGLTISLIRGALAKREALHASSDRWAPSFWMSDCVWMRMCLLLKIQKRSGDPNPQYFSKSTAVQMGGVLPYKWEAYCSTNGRCIAGFPFLRSLEARKVRRYKWGAYCRTNWRCTAVLFRQVVGVGVSETLPKYGM